MESKETPLADEIFASGDSPRFFSVFGRRRGKYFMKLFYYEAIMLFLPFGTVSTLIHPFFHDDSPQLLFTIIFGGLTFLALFIMDFIGFQFHFFDRFSRAFTFSFAIIGTISGISLTLFAWNGWDPNSWGVVISAQGMFTAFTGLSWYFVRANRGIILEKKIPYFVSTIWALFIISIMYLVGNFVHQFILIGMTLSFVAFLVIMRWELKPVTPKIKVRQLIKRFRRVTVWNFFIDFIKAFSVILSILTLSYYGPVILYPTQTGLPANQWLLNLAIVGFAASLAMLIYNIIQKYAYGLLVSFLMYFLNIAEFLVIYWFGGLHPVFIAIVNGFSLAALYFFIEQKMDLSSNVRSMPGSFVILIYVLFVLCIVLRHEPAISRLLLFIAPIISALGLAYLIGYVRDRPDRSIKVAWEPIIKQENV